MKHRDGKTLILGAALALAFATTATAQNVKPMPERRATGPVALSDIQLLGKADVNEDGRITRDEYLMRAGERFAELDTNDDGVIDESERPSLDRPRGPEERQAYLGNRIIKRFDENEDGKISAEEYRGPQERFAEWDANGDGSVEVEEITKALENQRPDPEAMAARALENMDGDKDGKVAREEFRGNPEFFNRMDKDGDSFLTQEEMQTAMNNRRDGERGRRPMMRSPEGGRNRTQAFIKRFDTDGNGTLDAKEFQGPEDRFQKLDADGNGSIDAEELTQAHERAMKKHQGEGKGAGQKRAGQGPTE